MSNSHDNKAYDGSVSNGLNDTAGKVNVAQFREEIAESQGCWQTFKDYPKSIFFIVGNEFCERFSYYGFRAVLTLYLINILQLNDDNATALFHAFTVCAYASPIVGSILADGYIGKFHTILWISLIYAVGNIILAFASTQQNHVHPWLDIIGLLIIAFGTGGIKPCVSAFGGDQFQKGQERMLESFFSVFYFSINAGACISSFITPIFRTQSCFGRDTCYPLAFGVPAVLMVVSCGFFILGSVWYKRYPPQENILAEFVKVLFVAATNKSKSNVKLEHWTEHYLDTHNCDDDVRCKGSLSCHKAQFVKDIRAVLRLLVMYIPLPFFWALYDQQGSRWVIQATQMDGYLGHYILLPDQVGTMNPILIMLFIPLFSGILYPLTAKCLPVTPLRKMVFGGFLAVIAYIITGFVQLEVDKTLPVIARGSNFRLDISNNAPCEITANLFFDGIALTEPGTWNIKHGEHRNEFPKLFDLGAGDLRVDFECKDSPFSSGSHVIRTASGGAYYLTVTEYAKGHLFATSAEASTKKSSEGEGKSKVSFTYAHAAPSMDYGIQVCLHNSQGDCDTADDRNYTSSFDSATFATDYIAVKPEEMWHMYLYTNGNISHRQHCGNFSLSGQGGIYTLSIYTNYATNTFENVLYPLASKNTVSVLMQIPQYIVITAAEILFSITGLEFSYSQAPLTMKSVLQAVYLLTISIGDAIIIAVAESNFFDDQAYEFFLFAGVMAVVMIVFALLCQFYYEYVYYIRDDDEVSEPPEDPTVTPADINDPVTENPEFKF